MTTKNADLFARIEREGATFTRSSVQRLSRDLMREFGITYRKMGISKIYFAQELGTHAIKIGLASNVGLRLKNIRVCSPYEIALLATIDGDRETEHSTQKRFEHARIRGEWFRPAPELLEYIEALPK